jgi:hypothetical protein
MQSSELAFFTAQELIEELMRRKTFMGVVVHSPQDWKDGRWGDGRTFKVHFNENLESSQASRLLTRVADYMDLNAC